MNKIRTDIEMLELARKTFASGKTLPLDFRKAQLKNLLRFYIECKEEILSALNADLRKAKLEANIYEIEVLRSDISDIIRNFDKYTKREALPFNVLACLDRAYVQKDPYGVVLILGTWNYPFAMTLMPLAGAIAAGNCAILKPSEVAPNSADTMARLLPKYIDPNCYQFFLGDVDATKKLLLNKFDYIFATGSTAVGRSIMSTAAANLTPVTLELGGKSPVYIDESADYKRAAKRIMWGKCANFGQTCIAPDYILCTKNVQDEIVKAAQEVLKEWYGSNSQESPDLARIVNERHFLRLQALLANSKAKIAIGGKSDQKDLFIPPTIAVDVDDSDSLMEDEIFGPILPIQTVNSAEEAIRKILSRPKPLALYIFSKKDSVVEEFIKKTSSGGVCVNDVIWHNGWEGLPFGGVGGSGIGNYHGRYSVETFSHKKAILKRGFSYLSEKLGEPRYPPYNSSKIAFFTFVLRYFRVFNLGSCRVVSHIFSGLFGAALLFVILHLTNN